MLILTVFTAELPRNRGYIIPALCSFVATNCIYILVFFCNNSIILLIYDGDISDAKYGQEMTSEFLISESVLCLVHI